MKSCLAVSLSLSSFFIKTFSTEAEPEYLYYNCGIATLTPNSTYQSNLDALLSSLSSAATSSTTGFANATAGQKPPDRAYGLFLYRGDFSIDVCRDCVPTATPEILRRCPNRITSIIWYDECMLRYSNWSIFSVMEESLALEMYNSGNFTNPANFVQALGDTIKDVTWRASGKRFAVADANVTTLMELSTMAQCTPDLMPWDYNLPLVSDSASSPGEARREDIHSELQREVRVVPLL